jgi:hypothetical protein
MELLPEIIIKSLDFSKSGKLAMNFNWQVPLNYSKLYYFFIFEIYFVAMIT